MAQTGFTPIQLYSTATAAAAPVAGNLAQGELAINVTDGKLFYKDNLSAVQTIAYKNVPISTVAGLGTGVATALAVNVGTAGAPVVNDGVLGTPSSGTVTNLTGTASININGTVGATTATTGAFTTLTASTNINSTRINPRTSTATSTATLTPDISAFDQYNLTAQASILTVAAPIGTPVDGNKLIIRIMNIGVGYSISWNATYTVIGTTLPASMPPAKMIYVGCIYNAANTRWDVVAVTTQV